MRTSFRSARTGRLRHGAGSRYELARSQLRQPTPPRCPTDLPQWDPSPGTHGAGRQGRGSQVCSCRHRHRGRRWLHSCRRRAGCSSGPTTHQGSPGCSWALQTNHHGWRFSGVLTPHYALQAPNPSQRPSPVHPGRQWHCPVVASQPLAWTQLHFWLQPVPYVPIWWGRQIHAEQLRPPAPLTPGALRSAGPGTTPVGSHGTVTSRPPWHRWIDVPGNSDATEGTHWAWVLAAGAVPASHTGAGTTDGAAAAAVGALAGLVATRAPGACGAGAGAGCSVPACKGGRSRGQAWSQGQMPIWPHLHIWPLPGTAGRGEGRAGQGVTPSLQRQEPSSGEQAKAFRQVQVRAQPSPKVPGAQGCSQCSPYGDGHRLGFAPPQPGLHQPPIPPLL